MNCGDEHEITIGRRRLLTGAASVAGAAILPSRSGSAIAADTAAAADPLSGAPAVVSPAPWTAYFGAVQDRPGWGTVQRGGSYADPAGNVRIGAVRDVLQSHHLLSWAPPHPSQLTQHGVNQLMNAVRSSSGRWWRDRGDRYTAGLIAAQRPATHQVLAIQLGNEITASGYGDRIERWARGSGLPYPHPRSRYGDGDGSYSRDYIGYYAEYFLAPAMQGIRRANRRAAPADRIAIALGSVVGPRHPFVVDRFLPALLEYELAGTFAPRLAGRKIKSLVRFVTIHYLLTPEKIFGYADRHGRPLPYGYRRALDDLHDRWVGDGAIRGIWHTEEGGKLAQRDDRHGSLALRVFARTMSWVLSRRVPPGQIRMFGMYKRPLGGWGDYQPRRETSWAFAMGVLRNFLGAARLIDRSSRIWAGVTDPVEKYSFETADHRRRVLVVTPQTSSWQGRTTLRWVRFGADGWTAPGSRISAVAHHFSSDAVGYRRFRVSVHRSADRRYYQINLPRPIHLDSHNDQQALMVTLRA